MLYDVTPTLSLDAVQLKSMALAPAVAASAPGAIGGCVSVTAVIDVTSEAVSLPVFVSDPPLTVAVFVTLGGAVLATFTVSVNDG